MGIHRDPALGFVFLALGLAALAILGRVEQDSLEGEPWYGAVFAPEGAPLWPGTMRTYATRIPLSNFPGLQRLVEDTRAQGGAAAVERVGFERTERLVAVEAEDDALNDIVSWGRPPRPGEPEVLAGVFTRLDAFSAGGRDYEVVGGIKRSVAGLHYAYVFPFREADETVTREWTAGWLDPEGLRRMETFRPEAERLAGQQFVGGMHPAEPARAWLLVGALVFVAVGGALIQLRLFAGLARRPVGILAPGFAALRDGRSGLFITHVLCYGIFFSAMAAGLLEPVWQLHFAEMVARQFADEGSLGYVGKAYFEGNIPRAAAATFVNNYLLQTVLLTFALSLVLPFFAVLKTTLTFALAGFALTPLWAETASGFTFHSITMAVELEAYVLVTYAACLYALALFKSMGASQWTPFLEGLKTFVSVTLIAGLILAVAAIYEAVTLIMLG